MWESGKRERIGTWPGALARAFRRSWIAQRFSSPELRIGGAADKRRCTLIAERRYPDWTQRAQRRRRAQRSDPEKRNH